MCVYVCQCVCPLHNSKTMKPSILKLCMHTKKTRRKCKSENCSLLLHRYTRKCEISKALNLSFSPVWRIILSEQKIRNVTKLSSFVERYDLMHSLLDLTPCPPEGLPIHSVCQICVYIFRSFARCSAGNQSKSGEKQTLQNVVITFAQTSNDGAHDPFEHRQAGNMADYL